MTTLQWTNAIYHIYTDTAVKSHISAEIVKWHSVTAHRDPDTSAKLCFVVLCLMLVLFYIHANTGEQYVFLLISGTSVECVSHLDIKSQTVTSGKLLDIPDCVGTHFDCSYKW